VNDCFTWSQKSLTSKNTSEIHHFVVFAAREEGALIPRAASNINHKEDA